jgi:HSP20 family molecular chaperone IbpA
LCPRTVTLKEVQCVINRRGWLLVTAPLEHRQLNFFDEEIKRRYEIPNETVVGNKIFYGCVENEEHRMIRKYLKKLERLVFPKTLRARIVKCEETQGTKIVLSLDCHEFHKEEINVTVKEAEAKIIVEARQERKDELCNTLNQFRREFVQWPIKIVNMKKVRTTITEERRLVIEIQTNIDLLPHYRFFEEPIEVKRA